MATALQLDKVFTTATANASSTAVNWAGGIGQFMASGTFDTCTVTLQMSPDDGTTWFDVGSDTTLTAEGIANFELGSCDLRADLSSVGGSTSISAWMTARK
jgi:hypothetical protein